MQQRQTHHATGLSWDRQEATDGQLSMCYTMQISSIALYYQVGLRSKLTSLCELRTLCIKDMVLERRSIKHKTSLSCGTIKNVLFAFSHQGRHNYVEDNFLQ